MDKTRKRVRYGIVGFGYFAGRTIAPAIHASRNSELIAIQKRSLEEAREKARAHQVPQAYDTPEALVADPEVDAIFIASANSRHCDEVVAAARAGKHVLLEKPMAMNVAEAERMIDVCRQNGVKLMVAHMTRFSPLVRRMQEVVASGELGDIIAVRAEFMFDMRQYPRSWFTDKALAGGGPVFDIGVHCLDVIRQVMQDEVVQVRSTLDPFVTATRTESTAQIALQFSRGAVGSIFISFRSPFLRRYVEFIGTRGIVRAPDFTAWTDSVPMTIERTGEGGSVSAVVQDIPIENLYVAEITHFSECIMNDTTPVSAGENGLANQRVLDAALIGTDR